MSIDQEQLLDNQMQAMANRLRTLRFDRGMRLIDLSAITGISEVHLYRMEQGERAPSLRTLLTLAATYGIDPGHLISESSSQVPVRAPHTGHAVWEGTESAGSGVMVKDGVTIQYDRENRVNPGHDALQNPAVGQAVGSPEALIGIAFAGCFSMALAAELEHAGFPAERIETFANVHTSDNGSQMSISEIALNCESSVAGISDEQFQTIAQYTKRSCMVARATATVPATLTARLIGSLATAAVPTDERVSS